MLRKRKAFTLLEIMMVLVVVAIILALSIPNFSKEYLRLELNKTADDLLTVGHWAQVMAMTQGRVYALGFSADRRTYHVEQASSQEAGDGQDDFEPVPGSLGKMHNVPVNVRLDVDHDSIHFYPDGAIEAASIQLDASKQKAILSSIEIRGTLTKTVVNE